MAWFDENGNPIPGPTSGNDSFVGTGADDVADGLEGDDVLSGGDGNDSLEGGDGADQLAGRNGNDTLTDSGGGANIFGEGGDDSIVATADGAFLYADGGEDDDFISVAGAGAAFLVGGAGNDTLIGPDGGSVLNGGLGDDSIVGGDGDDQIFDDEFFGEAGNDVLRGGAGDDQITSYRGADTIDGGAGDLDRLSVIRVLATEDLTYVVDGAGVLTGSDGLTATGIEIFDIQTGDGRDSIVGGAGDDFLDGGNNDDTIEGGLGRDDIYGGEGDDSLSDAGGGAIIFAGVGNDIVTAVSDAGFFGVQVFGEAGDDSVAVSGPDGGYVEGGEGNDTLLGGDGGDLLFGGGGDDSVLGGDGDDQITDDPLFGLPGNDLLRGGDGDDVIVSYAGADTLDGGAGFDRLQLDRSVSTADLGYTLSGSGLTGSDGTTAENFEDIVVFTGSGNDTLFGSDGNDQLYAGSGNNSVEGGDGFDQIVTGAGNDRISDSGGGTFIDAGDGNDTVTVVADTAAFTYSVATRDGEDWVSVSGPAGVLVSGDGGNDTIIGGDGDDILLGGEGDDSILGGKGNDQITATPGRDTVEGGEGDDLIVVGEDDDLVIWRPGDGNDTVTLGTGADTLDLQGAGWDSGTDLGGGAWAFSNGTDTVTVLDYEPGVDVVTCFTEGTRILTARGEVAVETLRAGDLVVAHDGTAARLQPVLWVGHTRARIAGHRDPGAIAPVLIRAGALAEGVPHRDLRVSPDHALLLEGRLVPAKHLVNGRSIVQEAWRTEVTYWHVELPAHALLVSEGTLTESYLDDGNRRHFDNGAVATLFKDFASERGNGRYEAACCLPMLREGMALATLSGRIAARAEGTVQTGAAAGRRIAAR